MGKDYREKLTYGSAIGMLVFGMLLTTAGFIIPPPGQIHDSVLYVLGQCLIFSGSVMGVGAYTSGKVREMRHDIDRRFRAYERGRATDNGCSEEEQEESVDEEEATE